MIDGVFRERTFPTDLSTLQAIWSSPPENKLRLVTTSIAVFTLVFDGRVGGSSVSNHSRFPNLVQNVIIDELSDVGIYINISVYESGSVYFMWYEFWLNFLQLVWIKFHFCKRVVVVWKECISDTISGAENSSSLTSIFWWRHHWQPSWIGWWWHLNYLWILAGKGHWRLETIGENNRKAKTIGTMGYCTWEQWKGATQP